MPMPLDSTLPPLPRRNKTREADFGVQFRAWLKDNPIAMSASFELKHARGDSFPYKDFKPEQVAYASRIAGAGALIRVQGLSGEPDYVFLTHALAYVAIKYPAHGFAVIRVSKYVAERDGDARKSLLWTRAMAIADYVHLTNPRAPPRT